VVTGGKDKNGVTINDTTSFITREGFYSAATFPPVRDLQHFFTFVAKLMPKALELLFPPTHHCSLNFSFKWLPVTHKITNDTCHYRL
jgi:hypothetical protein